MFVAAEATPCAMAEMLNGSTWFSRIPCILADGTVFILNDYSFSQVRWNSGAGLTVPTTAKGLMIWDAGAQSYNQFGENLPAGFSPNCIARILDRRSVPHRWT